MTLGIRGTDFESAIEAVGFRSQFETAVSAKINESGIVPHTPEAAVTSPALSINTLG